MLRETYCSYAAFPPSLPPSIPSWVFNGTLEATSEEEWDKTFDINVKSMFHTCKTCISMVSTPNNVTRSLISGCLTLNMTDSMSIFSYCYLQLDPDLIYFKLVCTYVCP